MAVSLKPAQDDQFALGKHQFPQASMEVRYKHILFPQVLRCRPGQDLARLREIDRWSHVHAAWFSGRALAWNEVPYPSGRLVHLVHSVHWYWLLRCDQASGSPKVAVAEVHAQKVDTKENAKDIIFVGKPIDLGPLPRASTNRRLSICFTLKATYLHSDLCMIVGYEGFHPNISGFKLLICLCFVAEPLQFLPRFHFNHCEGRWSASPFGSAERISSSRFAAEMVFFWHFMRQPKIGVDVVGR